MNFGGAIGGVISGGVAAGIPGAVAGGLAGLLTPGQEAPKRSGLTAPQLKEYLATLEKNLTPEQAEQLTKDYLANECQRNH
jgi:hypothetical protein